LFIWFGAFVRRIETDLIVTAISMARYGMRINITTMTSILMSIKRLMGL
jgi:hypothetical protein